MNIKNVIEAVVAGLIVAMLVGIWGIVSNLQSGLTNNTAAIQDIREESAQVNISALPRYVHNSQTFPTEVSGYPMEVRVDMKEAFASKTPRFVHLFQRETGGQAYYYQDSFPFVPNSATSARVYLGGKNDINKTYQIVALINEKPPYQKNAQDIYEVTVLPGAARGGETFLRR